MAKVTVFRFSLYDITSDAMVRSRRWGMRDAIARLGAVLHEDTAVEIDDADVISGDALYGFTQREYNPYRTSGFQQQVKI